MPVRSRYDLYDKYDGEPPPEVLKELRTRTSKEMEMIDSESRAQKQEEKESIRTVRNKRTGQIQSWDGEKWTLQQ